jgi:tryptophan 2,3-dioxygenase
MNEKDLWTAFSEMVERQTSKPLRQALLELYQKRDSNFPLYLLSEALMEFDQSIGLWREHHVRVVERIIGHKPGTGKTSGVGYLKAITAKKCFPLLWEIRTDLEKI